MASIDDLAKQLHHLTTLLVTMSQDLNTLGQDLTGKLGLIMATQDDERAQIADLSATFTAYKDAVTTEFAALEAAIAALPGDVPTDITDSLANLKTAIVGAGGEIPPAP